MRLDGEVYTLEDVPPLDKHLPHTLEIVVDRLVGQPDVAARLTDSAETAQRIPKGSWGCRWLAEMMSCSAPGLGCPDCGVSYPEMTPRLFSFNSPGSLSDLRRTRSPHGI